MQRLKETIQLYEARLNAWYEEGCEVPPCKSGAPIKSGLQDPPIIVAIRFEPPIFRQVPLL